MVIYITVGQNIGFCAAYIGVISQWGSEGIQKNWLRQDSKCSGSAANQRTRQTGRILQVPDSQEEKYLYSSFDHTNVNFRCTPTLSFMVGHLAFLHAVYTVVLLIVLRKWH
jgi:hypothetical protein